MLGQIVTSGMAGLLAQVDLPVGCAPSSNLILEIRDWAAGPGNTVLASQIVTGLPDSLDWRSFALANPPFIAKETFFAIVLSSPGDCEMFTASPGADPYPRGEAYYAGSRYPPGIWSLLYTDLGFKTFVEPICSVPLLVGITESEARRTLAAYGCTVGRVTRTHSRTVPKNEVISQGRPEATQLAAGSAVGFVVSLGRAHCKVPNVGGKTLARASSFLTRANCRVGAIRRAASSTAHKGRVIRQRPAPGARLPNGGRVNLVLGRGGRP